MFFKISIGLVVSCLLLTACSDTQEQITTNHFQHQEHRHSNSSSFHICYL